MDQQNDYQFVMIPQQLSSCLDANCHKMLSTLLGLHSLLANEDGWFFRSNRDLQLDARLSENVIRATLDTLYRAGIINIDCIGKGRGHRSNRIHINFESFKKYQEYSFNDIRNNPDLWIETVKYKDHFVPSYMRKSEEICESKCEGLCECICEKVSTNIDTTDTLYSIENTNSIEKDSLYKEPYRVYTKEECDKTLDRYVQAFIREHPDFNYLLDISSFQEHYYDYVVRLQLFLKDNLGGDISIKDTCLLILGAAENYQGVGIQA